MLADELVCRIATPEDAAELAAFGAESFVDAYGYSLRPGDLALHVTRTYSEELQRRELTDSSAWTVLVERCSTGDSSDRAAAAKELVGAALLRIKRPPADPAPELEWVEIARFYVARLYWRTGVSTELMMATLRSIRERGQAMVWLQTWERAEQALRFYRKWGFLAIGETSFLAGTQIQRDLVLARRVGAG